MNLKKIGKALTSTSVGTGPSSCEKRIYWAAVSQTLRNNFRVRPVRPEPDTNLLPMLVVQKFATVLKFNAALTAVLM